MPKSTHFHQTRDVMITDKKFRPEDEGIYQEEKQEFQESEKDKKTETPGERGNPSMNRTRTAKAEKGEGGS